MGIYLPFAVTGLIIVGTVLGYLYNRWAARQGNPGFAERLGVLTATGMIVGDSLFNVAFAGIVAAADDPAALAILEEGAWQMPTGVAVFAAAILMLYAWTRRRAAEPLAIA
jgi:hypothetical protein